MASEDISSVTVIGRLVADADVKTFTSSSVMNFTVAQTVGWGDHQHSIFIPCKMWGNVANLAPYMKKGTKIACSGSLDQDQWTGDDGRKQNKTVIVANKVNLLQNAASSQPQTQTNDNPYPGDVAF